MTSNHAIAVTLRSVTPEDEAFLFEVYAGTRWEELAQVPWDEAQKEAFLTFQFNAQHQHYQSEFADANFHVILDDGAPVGRLYVDRRADEIRILDIALLPEHRGRGIGGALLGALLAEAEAAGTPVRIFVESHLPHARRFFERLGFTEAEDHGVSVLMAWHPAGAG